MMLQHQTVFGRDGNCLAACIASLFAVPLETVPHFCERDDGSWHARLVEWCRPRGVYPLHFGASGKDLWHHWLAPGQVTIVEGPGPRGFPHVVLYQDGELLWDPHPEGGGLERVEQVWVFTVLEPALLPRRGSAPAEVRS